MLRAWQGIEAHYPEWSLRIVGEGEKRNELETQIAELRLKHVCLAGQTNNIAAEYSSASIFVLSSRYEGLPLALIEAMWCGLPCVAFDCLQGPAELLTDNRGWLVPSGNIQALTKQLEYAITHPKETKVRAQQAQTYAHTTFNEAAIMPKWVQLIEKK